MATDIEIFVGTSQDFLLSFKVKQTDDDQFVLERFIAHRCHNGQIICMDTCGKYLATGGGDDRIVIIDLKLNRDVHEIVRHEGSINSLAFTNKGSDLLSASEDGRLVATTVGSWKPTNIWKKPHTGKAVTNVCLHVSDKFALTLGKDGTLRGWDMFHGTQIKTFNTKDLSFANITMDNVVLCPDGRTFAISGAKTVSIISLVHDEPYDELTLNSRVTSMCWVDDENLLIGMENGSIEWANINASTENVNLPNIHTRRIKGMHHLNGFLGTISSNGAISLWSVGKKKLTLLCTTTDESIRPTCVKMIDSTENRYNEPTADSAESIVSLKDYPLRESGRNLRTISTTGKVIVEADVDEDEMEAIPATKKPKLNRKSPGEVTDNKLEVSSEKKKRKKVDTDIETVPEETKTKSKKKKTVVSQKEDDEAKTTTPTTRSKSQKNKTPKTTTPQKPIVTRSPNSDDDFETKRPEKKTPQTAQSEPRNSKAKKKLSVGITQSATKKSGGKDITNKKVSPNITVDEERSETKTSQRKSIAKKVSQNTPVSGKKSQPKSHSSSTPQTNGGTVIRNNELQSLTPLSRSTGIVEENGSSPKSLKKKRLPKLDLNATEPMQPSAKRNKRKNSI